jgi:hypothetical protein
VSGIETEAEGDATDVEGAAAAAAGEGGDAGALTADLPAELSALVMAANTDQSQLPDLFGDPQIFGESLQPLTSHECIRAPLLGDSQRPLLKMSCRHTLVLCMHFRCGCVLPTPSCKYAHDERMG